jgi:hypothetical protein
MTGKLKNKKIKEKTTSEVLEGLSQELKKISAKQNSFIEPQKLLLPIPKDELIAVWVNFLTYNEDKDGGSRLQYNLHKATDGKGVAFGLNWDNWFAPNNLSSNFGLDIQNIINRNEIFDLIFTIKMERFTGTDLWIYQPIVSLMFDDGTILKKKFEIDALRENQNHSFFF